MLHELYKGEAPKLAKNPCNNLAYNKLQSFKGQKRVTYDFRSKRITFY